MAERHPSLKSNELSALLPYLSEGFCNTCKGLLETRLRNLSSGSEGKSGVPSSVNTSEQNELVKISQVGRKKDFYHMVRVNGKQINMLQGLELHTQVFSAEEQQKIVDHVYDLQRKGQSGILKKRTYTAPQKWMRGKGRVTIQFGCCYNYAVDRHGNQPGVVRDEDVDPLPPMLKSMIKRLVK